MGVLAKTRLGDTCCAWLCASLVACGGAPLRLDAIDSMERVRAAAAAQEGAHLAPEVHARAEQERDLALRSHAEGDEAGATLHAERAVAAYDHALAVARLARATTELADAQTSLEDATAQVQGLEASREKLQREAEDLQQQVRVARERLLPAPSQDATGEREAARRMAARSLATQARLLCDAARLIASDAAGLLDADGSLADVETRLTKGAARAPIDDAAGARVRCLSVLTRARRAAGDDVGDADALLAELSEAGGWDPVRDERGVVVTIRGAFHGSDLTSEGAKRLSDLGRVAAAHGAFRLQIVLHDAVAPAPKDPTDAKRAEAAAQALVAAGASAARMKTELAGARNPVVDPRDPAARERNDRMDIVFIP
jgi:hypothetical protein